jgi:hypothetical protein
MTPMDPNHVKDVSATACGSLSAAGILATVRWEAVWHGEEVKIVLAILLLVLSYLAYHHRTPPGGSPA